MSPKQLKRQRITERDFKQHVELTVQGANIAAEKAEQALLGAVLQMPELYAAAHDVQPGDFYYLWHAYVWHAFDTIAARGEPIDPVMVATELEKAGKYNQDSAMRLAQLVSATPNYEHIEIYARRVREMAMRRRLMQSAMEVWHAAQDSGLGQDELVDKANQLLFDATEQYVQAVPNDMRAISSAYYELMEDALNNGAPAGVTTGFDNLDSAVVSFVPKEVYVLAGSEGMGKTTMFLSMLRNLTKREPHTVGVLFSLEMVRQEVVQIFTAMESGVFKDKLRRRELNQMDWSAFVKANAVIANWNVHIVDEYPTLTPMQLRRKLRRMIQYDRLPVGIVYIDGLWLMNGTQTTKERWQEVSDIMRDLNQIARDFNVPIVITHQYNGEAWQRKDKRPTMRDLAESAGVRRNAQVIMGLYRAAYYGEDTERDVTQLYILKDRNGSATGQYVDFLFNRDRACYEGA